MSEETKNNPGPYIRKAKMCVLETFNNDFPIDILTTEATPEDFYVVWFVKVLGNWKALLSTDIVDGHYWEVTYDGNKKQTYVDKYLKVENVVITDEGYSLIDPLA